MDWIDLPQERDRCRALVYAVNGHSGFIKCGEFLD